jgi:signal transduction histidine kinase
LIYLLIRNNPHFNSFFKKTTCEISNWFGPLFAYSFYAGLMVEPFQLGRNDLSPLKEISLSFGTSKRLRVVEILERIDGMIKWFGIKRHGVALEKRADLTLLKTKSHLGEGTLKQMLRDWFRSGFGYIMIGAWATCSMLRVLGIVSFDALFPAMLYLGFGALATGVLFNKGLQIHFRGKKLARTLLSNSGSGFTLLPRTTAFLTSNAKSQNDEALLGHEIKNYLCTLKGNAHLLRQRGATGEQASILDRIDRVVEKLEGFAKNLGNPNESQIQDKPLTHFSAGLDNSKQVKKQTAKPREGNRAPMKIGEVASECVGTHFHNSRDSFIWNAQEEGAEILGDADRLEQVFVNLYKNAREAGAIKIETHIRREGNQLLVTVEDDGVGCNSQAIKKIFEPFYSTKSGPIRRGLGMFIVQSIVESHGGRIRVQTKNGFSDNIHGLVFTMEFPIRPEVSVPVRVLAHPIKPALSFPPSGLRRTMPKHPGLPASI